MVEALITAFEMIGDPRCGGRVERNSALKKPGFRRAALAGR